MRGIPFSGGPLSLSHSSEAVPPPPHPHPLFLPSPILGEQEIASARPPLCPVGIKCLNSQFQSIGLMRELITHPKSLPDTPRSDMLRPSRFFRLRIGCWHTWWPMATAGRNEGRGWRGCGVAQRLASEDGRGLSVKSDLWSVKSHGCSLWSLALCVAD